MHVEIDEESKKWIESKGNQLTVKMLEVDACCAPCVQELVAIPGEPKTFEQYKLLKIGNLTIYIQNFLYSKEKLTLKISGVSFLKSISAKIQ
ncbi:CC/Se motif family (seleno)protein [Niallia sp. Sow4_A1]|uniref:CC/Se motif family (Seleno)protein n=1 Tax=Niallia hominis TaxID=3133173 RepID=A0ABV1F118_9BACI|nr:MULTISPECIES: CC/Se motif family (seleno)protein [Bacillaceae]MCM3364417.1 Fe-S oxidoreductase [Niallia sp. MER TA 168]